MCAILYQPFDFIGLQLCDRRLAGAIQCQEAGGCAGSENGACWAYVHWSYTLVGESLRYAFDLSTGRFAPPWAGHQPTGAFSVRSRAPFGAHSMVFKILTEDILMRQAYLATSTVACQLYQCFHASIPIGRA